METTLSLLAIGVLILVTGLSAGLYFTWSNAVTPGIGKLDDLGYLTAFQEMNRAILNPSFFTVFFGPVLLGIINLFLYRSESGSMFWLLVFAVALYFVGVVLITVFGNVPLNELLDNTDLGAATIKDLNTLRTLYEAKWNQFHTVRTISAMGSMVLLLVGLIKL